MCRHSRAALWCDQRRHSFAFVLRGIIEDHNTVEPQLETTTQVEPQQNQIAWFRRPSMRTNWLLIVSLATFGSVCEAPAQVADIAGVLPGDRWVYEVTDEITGDIKQTTTVVVLDVSEKEINTRVSTRGANPRQIVFDRGWSRIDDSSWKFTPSD